MKNKAFTIIEVLVAVIILATVVTALFQISINSKNNYIFYKKKLKFENLSSLLLFREETSNTNLYEQIRKTYSIQDDELRRILKNIKISKKTKIVSTVKISDEIGFNITRIQLLSNIGNSIYYEIGLK